VGKKITHVILIFSCVRESLRLFGSFGFSRLACGSAKTKCAYLRVGFFRMLHNVLAALRSSSVLRLRQTNFAKLPVVR
jgi:hypothetical protein